LNPLLNRSFIIKDYNSLSDQKPMGASKFQASLMESLTAILWVSIEDAERLARKKNKKIILDVYTEWCGWCKIMEKNTYHKKRIIQYINEHYYAVRLDAENRDSVSLMGRTYYFLEHARVNELAYSLLDGNMEYPSTVFLDERMNLLTIIPGYITPEKMEILLHYFVEDAYKTPGQTFQDYERKYYLREQD
jgi:thioredoxin-related protein